MFHCWMSVVTDVSKSVIAEVFHYWVKIYGCQQIRKYGITEMLNCLTIGWRGRAYAVSKSVIAE